MYSEIITNNKVVINRLDDEEAIILEDFYNRLKENPNDLNISKLEADTGTFGGILLEIKDKNLESEEIIDENNPEED